MAEKMLSINDLMTEGLNYALDFENKVSEEAKKMAEGATDPEAKDIFSKSVTKGKEYAQRLQQVFEKLGAKPETRENGVAKAMINEVEQMIANTDESPVRDAALIVAANQMQQYRVAVYGSLSSYAELLGKTNVLEGLQQNLQDSKGGDEKLSQIAKNSINKKAAQATA